MNTKDLIKLFGTSALALVLFTGAANATGNHHHGGGGGGGGGGNSCTQNCDDDDDNDVTEVISNVVNGQLNLGDIWANLNVEASNVDGDVSGTAAAIANSFSAELAGHATVENFQQNTGDIRSHVDAAVSDIGGDVDLTSAAVANTTSIVNEPAQPCGEEECIPLDQASLDLHTTQVNGYIDPSASMDIYASGVGSLNGTSAAIANSLSVTAWNNDTNIASWQRNEGDVNASVNAAISNVNGNVSLTAAAVGNTVSISTLTD